MIQIEATPTFEELAAEAQEWADGIRGQNMVRAMREAVMLVLYDARLYVPVDTGRLRADILPEIAVQTGIVEGVVGNEVEYARVVHETHPTKDHYLDRALDDNLEEIVDIFDRMVGKALEA